MYDFDFARIETKLTMLADLIAARREEIIRVLSSIESHHTSVDEINRSIDCLRNIRDEKPYLTGSINSLATFLPVNLPLYSLVLFAVIPGCITREQIFVRPPTRVASTIAALLRTLEFSKHFPQIKQCDYTRRDFIDKCANPSEVVIFTGTYKNAVSVRSALPKSTLFIFNGQGVNPLVIAEDCDIALAVAKTCDMKSFNSGQDCAAPDMILCHSEVIDEFRDLLAQELANLKVGTYEDPEVIIGPLVDPVAALDAGKTISLHAEHVRFGGKIDFARSIVYPTIIDAPTSMYDEVFAPVLMLRSFTSEEDLRTYFEHPTYRYHAMYASLFGSSAYLADQQHTQILQNQIVLDVERGNEAYGGFTPGASFAAHGKHVAARPILISREIDCYLRGKH